MLHLLQCRLVAAARSLTAIRNRERHLGQTAPRERLRGETSDVSNARGTPNDTLHARLTTFMRTTPFADRNQRLDIGPRMLYTDQYRTESAAEKPG